MSNYKTHYYPAGQTGAICGLGRAVNYSRSEYRVTCKKCLAAIMESWPIGVRIKTHITSNWRFHYSLISVMKESRRRHNRKGPDGRYHYEYFYRKVFIFADVTAECERRHPITGNELPDKELCYLYTPDGRYVKMYPPDYRLEASWHQGLEHGYFKNFME
jgi:hypothetical protein